jgi:hypothetical protein
LRFLKSSKEKLTNENAKPMKKNCEETEKPEEAKKIPEEKSPPS